MTRAIVKLVFSSLKVFFSVTVNKVLLFKTMETQPHYSVYMKKKLYVYEHTYIHTNIN